MKWEWGRYTNPITKYKTKQMNTKKKKKNIVYLPRKFITRYRGQGVVCTPTGDMYVRNPGVIYLHINIVKWYEGQEVRTRTIQCRLMEEESVRYIPTRDSNGSERGEG